MALLEHQQRVVEEHAVLTEKLQRLNAFIHLGDFVDRVPDPTDRDLLIAQAKAMQEYNLILLNRISRFPLY